MKKITVLSFTIILFTFSVSTIVAQEKILDHSDFDLWHTIQGNRISPNGEFILYSLLKGEKDHYLKIKDSEVNTLLSYDRGSNGKFTYDSKYALFNVKIWADSLKELKRKKTKKEILKCSFI